MTTFYKNRFEALVTRCLGLVDHNPHSKTYGCADRNYWHYMDGKSFPVSSFQVSILGIAASSSLRSLSDFNGQEIAESMILWWSKEVKKKGLVDEYFSEQRSFCATAYTSMSIGLCLHHYPIKNRGTHEDILKRAVNALLDEKNRPESANQTLAAMLAFDMAFENHELNPFYKQLQEDEFYLLEYGGFDYGYTLKCVDICCFALISLPSEKGKKYRRVLEKILPFLYWVTKNFTFHPSLSSRGNPHKLIGGLSLLASSGLKQAGVILDCIEEKYQFLVTPECCDDKYLSFFHLNSSLLSVMAEDESSFSETYNFTSLTEVSFKEVSFEGKTKNIGPYIFHLGKKSSLCVNSENGSLSSTLKGKAFSYQGLCLSTDNKVFIPSGVKVIDCFEDEWHFEVMSKEFNQKVTLVQNPFFSFALNIGLKLPFVGQLIRQYIYSSATKRGPSLNSSRRVIRNDSNGLFVSEKVHSSFRPLSVVSNWNFTDGHSTRMFGQKEKTFFLTKENSGHNIEIKLS